MRIESHFTLSKVNGRSVQPSQQKTNGYPIHYGKCSRIVGTRTRKFDGKFDVCATGSLIPLLHESRAYRVLEGVRKAFFMIVCE